MTLSALSRKFTILAALQHRDFRLYWSGFFTAVTGMQMSTVVQAWLIYDLTGSALHLGLIGLVRAIPAFFLGLVGGVVADKVDQRKLLIVTTAVTALLYTSLGTLTLTGMLQVWHILTTIFLVGTMQAFEQPSRGAIFPNLIDRRHLMSAVGLNSLTHPGTRIFAPIVAGLLIDHAGAGLTGAAVAIYAIGACYLIFSYMMFRVHLPHVQRARGGNGLQDLADGMRYILHHRIFSLLIGMSFVNAFFAMAHVTLLPIFAERLTGEASGSALALLFSANGLGGLLGAVIGGSLGSIRRRGWLIIGGSGAFGSFLILFALSPWYALSVVLEWIASIGRELFGIAAQSSLHSLVPDEFRGRVMGIWGMQHTVMQPLGGLQMGALAGAVGAPLTVAIGGGAVALFAFLGIWRSRLVRNLGDLAAVSPSPGEPAATIP